MKYTACAGSLLLLVSAVALGAGPSAAKTYEVQFEKNIAYYDGAVADAYRHRLDVYLPKGKRDFPVVMFVHGGGWTFCDKDFFGVHAAVGKMFARHGIGAVLPNYRLSPAVQHPEHIKDVARAFAWSQRNMKQRGGRTDALFVCGHSAGGHLVALLATDESYLKAEGLSLKHIRAAMPISGVFDIPDGFFTTVFGKDKDVRKQASPLHQVRAGCPPFLILYADKDFPFCDVMSRQFGEALRARDVPATTQEIRARDHFSIIGALSKDDDPCGQALLDFVARHSDR